MGILTLGIGPQRSVWNASVAASKVPNIGTLAGAPNASETAVSHATAASQTASLTSADSATVTSSASSGLTVNFILDSSVASAPTGFTDTLNKVAAYFASTFSDPITLNIAVGYGEVGGSALSSGALGQSSTRIGSYTYSQIKSALAADAKSPLDSSAVASLPASDPTGGGHYWVSLAEAKALGLSTVGGQDGSMGFAASAGLFDYDNSNGVSGGQYDFFGVVVHEVTEIMGRQLLAGFSVGGTGASYEPEDLFHFASPGVRTFLGTTPGYFSGNGGTTNLGTFNTNTSGDIGDWASSVGADSFLAFAQSATVLPVSNTDLQVMDAIGWDLSSGSPAKIPIETAGVTTLASTADGHYYLLDSTGAGPTLKYGGADVTAGQFAGWSPIGAEKTASGYEIAWKNAGAGQYTLWNTDNSGAYTSNVVGAVAGSDPAIVSAESIFMQDLNGDGVIGSGGGGGGGTPIPIESFGVTTLASLGSHYVLLDSTGTGPSLKYSGADVTAGQFAGWTPIGAEKTGSGYEIAWKNAGAGQYTLWNTDNSGAYTGNAVGAVAGSDPAIVSAETIFMQDLNGDGIIGSGGGTMTPIETAGVTTLATSAGHYYLLDSTGNGPSLKYGGADVTAGEFAGWSPIGAEKTASGYEIAWKNAGAGLFTLWNTDNSGAFTSNVVGAVAGSDPAIVSAENLFLQDFNGDGRIGTGGSQFPSGDSDGDESVVINQDGTATVTGSYFGSDHMSDDDDDDDHPSQTPQPNHHLDPNAIHDFVVSLLHNHLDWHWS